MSQEKLLTVSLKAAAKIREFMSQQGKGDHTVHVVLVQTHCMRGAGYGYHFDFERQIHDGQESFENDGLRFAVDASSASRLRGTTIDYVETLESQGFVVKNPNAFAKCPCGHHDIFESK